MDMYPRNYLTTDPLHRKKELEYHGWIGRGQST
jgi:hypothetical protein